jgi:hypothetical protein
MAEQRDMVTQDVLDFARDEISVTQESWGSTLTATSV